MIIYIFDNNKLNKITISTRLGGMYPIDINDKVIANVYSEGDKWFIKYSDDYDTNQPSEVLEPFKVNVISSKYDQKKFIVIATPKYDENEHRLAINGGFTIGSNPKCDICYSIVNSTEEVIQVVPQANGKWQLKTNAPLVFVNDKKINGEAIISNGDIIFYYGLKIALVGKMIIVNNPNSLLKINNSVFQNQIVEGDYTPTLNNNSYNDEPLIGPNDYFFKSPRFNFIVEEKEVIVDSPPDRQDSDDIPAVITVGPQLTMMSVSAFSLINVIINYANGEGETRQFVISVATVSMMILGAVLWPSLTRFFNKRRIKRKEKKRQERYSKYLEKKKREIFLIKEDQKNILHANHLDNNQCLNVINSRSKELWQRNIDHNDFLDIRLGIGNDKPKILIKEPEEQFTVEDDDNLIEAMHEVIKGAKINENVPITYNFTEESVSAVVGTKNLIKDFMDSIFLKMMTLHSYVDLKIVVFSKNPDKWEYLKMAPHLWDNQRSIRYFSSNVDEFLTLSTELERIFDARVAEDEEVKLDDDGGEQGSKSNYKNYKPYYLFFIDDISSVRNVSLIKKILKYKRNMGFSLILTSQSVSDLPSETSDFICITEKDSAIMTSKINDNQKIFQADYNTNSQIDMSATVQKLANIPIMVEKAKYELPQSLTFLEMYNVGRVEQLNSLTRWEENDPIHSLSVPVGIDQNGEIFKMDIHEKAYGPHGLVAGTTGSGKSEWIITYILSLAVNFNPDEVQFVLIDYKGGGLAKSFENEDLNIKLPHLAGTITNLDKSEIFRSISAIESELKRRQSIFNDAREKLKEGSMNIYKYQEFYRKGLLDQPMSHLLIICDEFAELKQQQPEFMDQLISTSRIGRSLGIHLILATQKPSGVVNDQIWSNSKFKVCLKVQDKGDSNEVLKKPDAAFLKQTGAFYLQVGNDDYYNLGQSAWAGAKYFPSDILKKQIDESIQYIDNIGQTKGTYDEDTKQEVKTEGEGEELLNIVSYISNISNQITLKSPQLWLPNVPTQLYLPEIIKKYNKTSKGPTNYEIAIGEYDEPRRQEQGMLTIDLAAGNVAIMGQPGSGTETLVSTIIFSTLIEHTPNDVNFYIIDFGAETLKKFAKFPQVGEVVFQEDMDKVVAVLDLIDSEVERRKELLSDYNGSFEYYNKTQKDKLPLITVVINAYDVFCESLPKLVDLINNFFRDYPKYGVVFVASVSTATGLRPRQLQFFNHTIVMQFNDDSQYRTITNCRRGLIPKKTLGRGICKLDSTEADSYCEFQTAFVAPEEKELDYIRQYAEKCNKAYKTRAKQLAKIPDDVSSEDLISYITDITAVPIGVDFIDKTPTKYNFAKNKINLISSKNLNNSIKSVYGITAVLSKVPGVKIRIIDFNQIFKKIILDTKMFNDNLDVVFGAIERDVLNRKETQDWAINIVLGIGSYKKYLSKAGMEIFHNTFNNIKNSKKIIFLLIDDYDKLRTLKLEEWFDQVDDKSGIWLGNDVNEQSIITANEADTENRKLNFEGMAYQVEDSVPKFIKTVLDGED